MKPTISITLNDWNKSSTQKKEMSKASNWKYYRRQFTITKVKISLFELPNLRIGGLLLYLKIYSIYANNNISRHLSNKISQITII